MLVKQDLIDKIKDYFGLNVYETKVWLALLGKGVASAGEISSISGVPRSRTYDVLETLEKKGFAIIRLEKPVKYIGVKPNIILEKLRRSIHQDAEEKVKNLSKIKGSEEFDIIEGLYKKGESPVKRENISTALKGNSNISNYLKEIIQNAKKEVIICTDAKEVKDKSRLFQNTFRVLKEKKVKIKLALSGEPALISQINKNFNVTSKKINIKSKFFIIDKSEILFYLSNSSEEQIAIWLNSEFFVNSFVALFEKALEK